MRTGGESETPRYSPERLRIDRQSINKNRIRKGARRDTYNTHDIEALVMTSPLNRAICVELPLLIRVVVEAVPDLYGSSILPEAISQLRLLQLNVITLSAPS